MNLRKRELDRMARRSGHTKPPKRRTEFRYSPWYLVVGFGVVGIGAAVFIGLASSVTPAAIVVPVLIGVGILLVIALSGGDDDDSDRDWWDHREHGG